MAMEFRIILKKVGLKRQIKNNFLNNKKLNNYMIKSLKK